jgi:hypothetical protein
MTARRPNTGSALIKSIIPVVLPVLAVAIRTAFAETEDLGNGFFHHGVATPVSNHRGTVGCFRHSVLLLTA